jgi:serine acetyltransferase
MLGHTVHKNSDGSGGKIEDAPKIEEGVMVGRGAMLVGGICVGCFSAIGVNSVVLKDVEPFAVVTGVPGEYKGRRKREDVSDILGRMERDNYEYKRHTIGSF